MQANSERFSVLDLTNDRLNCIGLMLLLTIFVAWWAYYMRVNRHLSLSVRQRITVNFFIQPLQTFFIFVTFFAFFLTFFIFLGGGEIFLSMRSAVYG